MDKVKAESSGTCTACRGNVRKGSWALSQGGFYLHPKCYLDRPSTDVCEACGQTAPLDADGVLMKHHDPNRNGYVCDGSPAKEPKKCGGCGEPAPAHDKHCGEESTDPIMDGLISAGLVVPGDSAETHRRMLAGKPCHNGPTCPYCKPTPVSEAPATVEKMDDNKPGPLFQAAYDSECSTCASTMYAGDMIRADGSGSYECEHCAERSETRSEPAAVDGELPFAMPTSVEPEPAETNVSGQPEPARDQWGRYLLPHPVTGLYSDGKDKPTRRNGWMRATTFAKLAADTFSLTRYNERLTLLGATLRPDVVALAHGKHVKRDNKELNRLVTEVKETAGAKVAANIGTAVHSFTERVDAGTLTLDGVPADYRPHVESYLKKLQDYGLEPVPGLIERTTLVDEWGKVIVGTFDRVLYHRASGTYLIGDLKTGETLDWGKMEIAVQLALYAHGINAHGVFDWNDLTWRAPYYSEGVPNDQAPLLRVRTDFGVVMHLPIQGPNAGVCTLRRVNLAAGWDAAATSASVDTSRKRDDYMDDDFALPVAEYSPETPAELPPAEPMDWIALARLVQSKDDASVLWHRAKADGVVGVALNDVVQAAQQRLRELGVLG